MEDANEQPKSKAAEVKAQARWTYLRALVGLRWWWQDEVMASVDQAEVIARRREDGALSARYLFMTAMSGGIAILGLLQSSPAVVIGAMLLSPLMGPIMGLGFALAIGDYHWLRQSAKSLAWGSAMAIALCTVIVFLSPLQEITPEVASRTRPNLFDLFIALFSALAGGYAVIRGKEGTIVGVAIATALMPPLAVVGFGLATFNWTVFSGALLLFVTNLITIALTAWAMAKLYGFKSNLSEKQTQYQNFVVVAVFVALAVPLGFSLRQIAWETNATRQVRAELVDNFGPAARLSQPEIDFDGDPIRVSAFVWTTSIQPDAQATAARHLSERLGAPVVVDLKQFLVRDEKSAEQAQLSSAKAQEEAAANERVAELGARLGVVAGVEESDVLVDRQRRRALVRAKPLPGATLETYAALERRVAQTEPDWTIELVPPVARLPEFAFSGEELDTAQTATLQLAAWASARNGMALRVIGRGDAADLVAKALSENRASEVQRREAAGPVRIEWVDPAGE
ncbi:TIGR00341 family protein [Parerythrobacter lacustris]|uniref:TIGR00341 family protein n=1 Tax=Parerythrobacter lacustris TaxID=2969984 RepID=A0ABT1XXR7_9SPHN|nr:TIGR00341 family protein [Parerythrobacter lacustris]MCR2835247.1 TIGR00341 family protein [Parerythrobacter lacustris]